MEFLKKYRLIITVLMIFLILTILVIITSPVINKYQIQNTPTPTLIPAIPLTLVSISPLEDIKSTYLPVQQISFEFNQPVDSKDILYTVDPDVPTYFRYQPGSERILILATKDIWKKGVTTITVLPNTKSKSGGILNQSIIYKLNTDFPSNPKDVE